jgi:hypothetical protein
VALQEVWMRKDYDHLRSTLAETLPHSCYFQSGTLGSGLVLFSKYPILSSTYLKFTLAGRPLKILEGDYYVGKGCGSVCIDHPQMGYIDVYTTHVMYILIHLADHWKKLIFIYYTSCKHVIKTRMNMRPNVSQNAGKLQIKCACLSHKTDTLFW